MKNKTPLKIGLVISILVIINEIIYLNSHNGVGLPILVITLAGLVGYLYYYLLNKNN